MSIPDLSHFFEQMVDAMPQIAWTARPEGYMDYCNQQCLDYTGMTRNETLGWGWRNVVHPEDLPDLEQRWYWAVGTETNFEIEYRFRRGSDGAYRWHLGRGTSLRDSSGAITGWLGTSTDIHDQKSTEEELRQTKEHLEHLVGERTRELADANVVLRQELKQRVEAEEALRRNEEYFRAITENAMDIVTVMDADGTIRYESPAVERILGYKPGELKGSKVFDLVIPAYQAVAEQTFARELASPGQSQSVDIGCFHKDGSWRIMQCNGRALLDNPAIGGIVMHSRDVTEHRKAEEGQLETRNFLQATLDALTAHIAVLDHNGVIVAVNAAWERFAILNGATGRDISRINLSTVISPPDAHQSVGVNYLEACETAAGPCGEEAPAVAQGIRSVLAGELDEFLLEYPCHAPTVKRWFVVRVTPFGGTGPVRVVVAHENVTKRKLAEAALKESEERFVAFMDNNPTVAFIKDADGRLVYANATFARTFRMNLEDVLGKTDFEIWPLDVATKMREHDLLVLEGGEPIEVEEDIPTAENPDTSWLVFKFPLEDSQGRTLLAALSVDITKQKAVERMKSEFVSTVSHELRTPLTSIRGSLGLVLGGVSGQLPELTRSMVELAHRNTERLSRLINDILDSEKIESGAIPFHMQEVPLTELVESTLQVNEEFAQNLEVRFELKNHLPDVIVMADSDRLVQVLTNLLSNAAKFSPPGETVSVEISRATPSSGELNALTTSFGSGMVKGSRLEGPNGNTLPRIRIAVSNRGEPIPLAFRDRIFQKFAQADASDSRQRGGTGLGLNISKALTERMGGQISFVSNQEDGTTFFCDLMEAPVSGPSTETRNS